MGYNTAVVLYNDSLNELRNDAKAGEKIYEAAITGGRKGTSSFQYGVTLDSRHADCSQLIVVGGNNIIRVQDMYAVSVYRDDRKLEVARYLARELGYTLRKKNDFVI